MKILAIYDNTGYIFATINNYEIPQGGIQYLEIEIPEGKIIKNIDVSVTPNVPVYEDIPKSIIEQANVDIIALKAQVADTEYALMMGGLI